MEWQELMIVITRVRTGPEDRLGTVRTGWKVLRYWGCAMMRARRSFKEGLDVKRQTSEDAAVFFLAHGYVAIAVLYFALAVSTTAQEWGNPNWRR